MYLEIDCLIVDAVIAIVDGVPIGMDGVIDACGD